MFGKQIEQELFRYLSLHWLIIRGVTGLATIKQIVITIMMVTWYKVDGYTKG